jgi:hypothetical protein
LIQKDLSVRQASGTIRCDRRRKSFKLPSLWGRGDR